MTSEYPAITKCFLDAVDNFANPRAQMYRKSRGAEPGVWEAIPAAETLRRVAGLSKALAELGIKAGDRVGVFAPNCPEWAIADFAILGLGAASVPVYFHESPERLTYILKDSGARVVITAGEEQARKIEECRGSLPELEQVIAASPPAELLGDILHYETLIATAGDDDIAHYRRNAAQVAGKDLATIIYTSGTTGEPKGVMLTHANLTSNAIDSCRDVRGAAGRHRAFVLAAFARVRARGGLHLFFSRDHCGVRRTARDGGRGAAGGAPDHGGGGAAFFRENLRDDRRERSPRNGCEARDIRLGAPRSDRSGAVEGVWATRSAWECGCAGKSRTRWSIRNFAKAWAAAVRTFTSGSAPLSIELLEFFWSVGLPIYQGYGLTETSPVVSMSSPHSYKVGTVGRPIAGVELKIADDGEILVKGNCVMQAYYHKPDQTRDTFTSDGWLMTGDIGRIDEDGFLLITDRKKELLKTAGGKFVAPAPIENLLKTSPLIANAMVVGDRRKFVAVLVVANFAGIEQEAQTAGREFATHAQMLADPWVRDLYTRELDRLMAPLAQYERPKRFALLEKDFTYASGELTYTMKLKRRVIEERYGDTIEKMYADVEEPRPQRTA